ncbi:MULTISPECIES: MFS transporter [Providencia]|uniref:MFS transporter n=1 Tax=Providencia TaxID=586 RepID=UPI0019826756|nr:MULTISPECIES: MFS transporter [Providencia]MBN4865368.1 MHS family MFS transporter [Providencia stuartii]MBN4874407.1 MHS family MFS transporter [Providencia stuartii]MBN4879381.1 MHS family MFS transporter [Providencia stuartii]MBN4883608.1 MHS family MFS transporter [Providencia stuartii]HEM8291379.1 MHS family MFS transporter [Providencia stuartii]
MSITTKENKITPKERKYALASFIGTAIEWYDFYIYSTASALIFSTLFFSKSTDPSVALLSSFAAYGVGFFARPLGGFIAGHVGDKIGRKKVLVYSLLLMGVATFITGLIPSFDSIGIYAIVLLVIIRLLQGLASGAEWGGAALLAVEHTKPQRRGFIGSFTQIGSATGMLLASAAFLVVKSTMSEESFLTWGWRIPFFVSIILVVIGLIIRLKTTESDEFLALKKSGKIQKYPLIELIKNHKRSVFITIGLRLAQPAMYAILTTFILSYLKLKNQDTSIVLTSIIIASAVSVLTTPFWALLSDKIGRRIPAFFALISIGIAVWPFFYFLDNGNLFYLPLVMTIFLALFDAAIYSIGAAWFAEQFPVEVRYSGVSVGYQVGTLLSGGLTPFIATALLQYNNQSPYLVSLYISALCFISLIAAYKANDPIAKQPKGKTPDLTKQEAVSL